MDDLKLSNKQILIVHALLSTVLDGAYKKIEYGEKELKALRLSLDFIKQADEEHECIVMAEIGSGKAEKMTVESIQNRIEKLEIRIKELKNDDNMKEMLEFYEHIDKYAELIMEAEK